MHETDKNIFNTDTTMKRIFYLIVLTFITTSLLLGIFGLGGCSVLHKQKNKEHIVSDSVAIHKEDSAIYHLLDSIYSHQHSEENLTETILEFAPDINDGVYYGDSVKPEYPIYFNGGEIDTSVFTRIFWSKLHQPTKITQRTHSKIIGIDSGRLIKVDSTQNFEAYVSHVTKDEIRSNVTIKKSHTPIWVYFLIALIIAAIIYRYRNKIIGYFLHF